MQSCIGDGFEVTRLFKYLPNRNAVFNRIKADAEHGTGSGSGSVRAFCLTQWTVRGDSIGSILENYELMQLCD